MKKLTQIRTTETETLNDENRRTRNLKVLENILIFLFASSSD